jgi:hypothetical protein
VEPSMPAAPSPGGCGIDMVMGDGLLHRMSAALTGHLR